jgi:hypothetical protein
MRYISHEGKDLPVYQENIASYSGNPDYSIVLKPGEQAEAPIRYYPGYCSADDQVPVLASWVMDLPGMTGSITLVSETTFDVCSENLPVMNSIEVGSFNLEK